MDFRILGPLEVADGDSLVTLPGAKQRALLAILLLRVNEVVRPTGSSTTYGASSRRSRAARRCRCASPSCARRSAWRCGDDHTAAGVHPEARPTAVDLHRFERLVEEADAAGAAGAAGKLREALALWRGPPLADLSYESFAQPAIARLEELRLAVLEKRIEADLALGRHADLVAELEASSPSTRCASVCARS